MNDASLAAILPDAQGDLQVYVEMGHTTIDSAGNHHDYQQRHRPRSTKRNASRGYR